MESVKIGPAVKGSILICLVSLFLFVLDIAWGSYTTFFGWLFNLNPYHIRYVNNLGVVFWAAHVGITLRLTAVTLGLVSLVVLWFNLRNRSKTRRIIASALFLEGLYFLLYFPFVPYLWRPGTYFLSLNYLLQIFLTTPFLLVFSIKVGNFEGKLLDEDFWKWSGLTFLGYMSALWVNALFRWFDMGVAEGPQFLFSGIIFLGFLNGAIFMSLALFFSVFAAHSMLRLDLVNSKSWLGLALIMLGLHYMVYVVYSYLAGIMNFILLVDIWTLPVIFLGIVLLYDKITSSQDGCTKSCEPAF